MNPFSIDHQVRVTTRGVQRLKERHLWIYAGDISEEPDKASPPIVRVVDKAENVLGYAFYSRKSQIRLRMFSRADEVPTPELLHTRIEKSIARRCNLSGEKSAGRLVFGESDLLPSIIVDRYGDYLVLQTLSYSAEAVKPFIVESLDRLVHPTGILERNDAKVRHLEGLEEIQAVLLGYVPEEVEIEENDIRFLINTRTGQKTGFFLDQSENRIACRKHAYGEALDCFTNTGAFALHLAKSCETVLAIDISSDSLKMAQRNSDLNALRNVQFDQGNVFDYLRKLEDSGQFFNTICLDPPAFAKNRKALPGAIKGYKEINLRAIKLLKQEGILITSSCSYHVSEADFYRMLCEAARDAHRHVQIIGRRGQAGDHPVLAGMPETHYLKCFILRVL